MYEEQWALNATSDYQLETSGSYCNVLAFGGNPKERCLSHFMIKK